MKIVVVVVPQASSPNLLMVEYLPCDKRWHVSPLAVRPCENLLWHCFAWALT